MKKNTLLGILIIVLCIIIFMLLQDNKKLNSQLSSYEKYTSDYTMVFLTRDWTIPILSDEELNIDSLYQLKGRLNSAHSFTTRILGMDSEVSDYLVRSIKIIEKLIKLIESNSSKEDIEKLVNEAIDLQKEILSKYDNAN